MKIEIQRKIQILRLDRCFRNQFTDKLCSVPVPDGRVPGRGRVRAVHADARRAGASISHAIRANHRQIERWEDNGRVRKLQLRNGYFHYYTRSRECQDKAVRTTKLYSYT